jgi:hypothetical protein
VNEAAELWRFGPKAWKPYFNIRDPKTIQERAESEILIEKVTEGWAIGLDPQIHVKVLFDLFESGATGVHIHCGQHDQRKVIDFYAKCDLVSRLKKSSCWLALGSCQIPARPELLEAHMGQECRPRRESPARHE